MYEQLIACAAAGIAPAWPRLNVSRAWRICRERELRACGDVLRVRVRVRVRVCVRMRVRACARAGACARARVRMCARAHARACVSACTRRTARRRTPSCDSTAWRSCRQRSTTAVDAMQRYRPMKTPCEISERNKGGERVGRPRGWVRICACLHGCHLSASACAYVRMRSLVNVCANARMRL
eukprot:6180411-Pleurochrysis_carterae.AAC.2